MAKPVINNLKPHAQPFKLKPLRSTRVNVGGRYVAVITDFPLTSKNSKAYAAEITTHVHNCEQRRPAPKFKYERKVP